MFLYLGTQCWYFCFSPTLSESQRILVACWCSLWLLHWNHWPWFFLLLLLLLKVTWNHYLCSKGICYFFNVCPLILPYWLLANLWRQEKIDKWTLRHLSLFLMLYRKKNVAVKSCGGFFVLSFCFREEFLILELLSFHFPMPFHLLRE